MRVECNTSLDLKIIPESPQDIIYLQQFCVRMYQDHPEFRDSTVFMAPDESVLSEMVEQNSNADGVIEGDFYFWLDEELEFLKIQPHTY